MPTIPLQLLLLSACLGLPPLSLSAPRDYNCHKSHATVSGSFSFSIGIATHAKGCLSSVILDISPWQISQSTWGCSALKFLSLGHLSFSFPSFLSLLSWPQLPPGACSVSLVHLLTPILAPSLLALSTPS